VPKFVVLVDRYSFFPTILDLPCRFPILELEFLDTVFILCSSKEEIVIDPLSVPYKGDLTNTMVNPYCGENIEFRGVCLCPANPSLFICHTLLACFYLHSIVYRFLFTIINSGRLILNSVVLFSLRVKIISKAASTVTVSREINLGGE
jgi:hypothetical protein